MGFEPPAQVLQVKLFLTSDLVSILANGKKSFETEFLKTSFCTFQKNQFCENLTSD